jgi:N-acetylmuramoyl-L-alanine amidase
MLCWTFSCEVSAKRYTLVIDAGHGGRDAGACGAISKEKNLTLRYAQAFGRMVEQNCPDVNVIYTRKTDRFLELWQRAEIANKNKADLFISIHINALPKGHIARGFSTYTLGRGRNTGKAGIIENLEVAKRENSVILQEKNYKQNYGGFDPNSPESDILFEFIQEDNMVNSIELAKLMQKHVCAATGRQNQGAHQDNLAVLRLTSMPGCLVELGFISTKDEERFMNDKASLDKYARGMLNAFQAYRRKAPSESGPKGTVAEPKTNKEERTAEVPKDKPDSVKGNPEEGQESVDNSDPVFKVQFLTSNKRLKAGHREFKGLKGVSSYKEGGLWKYTVGASTNYSEIYQLRKEVLAKFPQAFIIAYRNGEKMDAAKAYQEFRQNKKNR